MDQGVRRQGRPTKTWLDGVHGDLKEIGLVLHWRKRCQNKEQWRKPIESVTGRVTKGELRSQGSRASGRLKERRGPVGPEVPVDGIDEQVKSDEQRTRRRRMSAKEREE